MKIGFFDSGVGGLTVLYEALKVLPHEDYLYYGDTAHVPYGNKPKEIVRNYVMEAVDFMVGKGIQALVVSCNAATSAAIDALRAKYSFPIIGMEPAVKPAVSDSAGKRVLVFATEMTLREEKFQRLVANVDNSGIVDYVPLQELVMHAERFEFEPEIILPYLKKKLSPFDLNQYGTIVLGCTHFPYFKDFIRKIVPPSIAIIDGNKGTVQNLKRKLEAPGTKSKGTGHHIQYYLSNVPTDRRHFEAYLRLMREIDHAVFES
ncbi:MAG: glutamate racemase [Desulfobacteraceae bacterium]|nr:MAG: glutamate racemase [Desulfobacteraceae bacterium]